MSDTSTSDLKTLLPWLHLLKVAPIAFGLRMIILGTLGWLSYSAGYFALSYLPFAPEGAVTIPFQSKSTLLPQMPEAAFKLNALGETPKSINYLGVIDSENTKGTTDGKDSVPEPKPEPPLPKLPGFSYFAPTEHDGLGSFFPVVTIWSPMCRLLTPGRAWASVGWDWTVLLWALLNWSLFGGALCRLAALQFGKQQRKSIVYALKFSRRQWLAYLIAPFLPLTGMLCVGAVNAMLGWVASWHETLGSVVLNCCLGVSLFLGYLMTMLALGFIVGWPLMIAAISTEDSDGFDGLSRSFGFLTDRPFHALAMAGVCTLLMTYFLALWLLLLSYIKYFTGASLAMGLGIEATRKLGLLLPENAPSLPDQSFWLTIFDLMKGGFGPSYFFTAVTLIYFLLRLSDDGTPLNVVVDVRDHELTKKPPSEEPVAATEQPAVVSTTATPSSSGSESA